MIAVASSIPVVKEVEELVDPATFNVVRFVMTAIPFVPLVLDKWDDVEIRDAGIELGFWVSLGYLMQAFGLITSDAGRASFISMLTVIFGIICMVYDVVTFLAIITLIKVLVYKIIRYS